MTAEPISYSCEKCSNPSFTGEDVFLAGRYGRFFDYQGKKFTAVTCDNCGYTEFYRQQSSRAGNILDILTSG